jgi:hypothetical protein
MVKGQKKENGAELLPVERLPAEAQKHANDGYILLLPTANFAVVSPHYRISLVTVPIDPRPEKGDVWVTEKYKDEQTQQWLPKTVALTKSALEKIASAMQITWHPLWTAELPRTNANEAGFRAVGVIKRPDGSCLLQSSTYIIDLIEEEKALRENYEERAKRKKIPEDRAREWIESSVAKAMNEKRRRRYMLAETGAKLRVIRSCAGIRPNYDPKELQKGFVVPTVQFTPDMDDPHVRREIALQGMHSEQMLYGLVAGVPTQVGVSGRYATTHSEADADFVDMEPPDEEPPDEPLADADAEEKKRLSAELTELIKAKVFTEEERAEIFTGLDKPGCGIPDIREGLEWAKAEKEAREEVIRREQEEAERHEREQAAYSQTKFPWRKGGRGGAK